MLEYPKISVCMITERRPQFMEFFAFCWNRLEWRGQKELAVATTAGNEESLEILEKLIPRDELVSDNSLLPRQYVGILRNKAKEIASGEWITWADDDDWFSPRRLTDVWEVIMTHPHKRHIQVMGMASDVPLLNLKNMRVKPRPRGVWWGGGFVKSELAKSVPFLKLNVGEDGLWFIMICRTAEAQHPQAVQRMATQGDMILCLDHGKNVSVGSDSDELRYWPLPVPSWLDQESLTGIYHLREKLGIVKEQSYGSRRV